MDARRLSWGEWVAGAAGLLMIVSLFLPWYSVGGHNLTAWQSMAVDDVILFVAAVLALGSVLAVGMRNLSSFSVAATSLAILPAIVGLILTVYRLISPAPPADAGLEIGAWLALVAAIGIAVGSWAGATDDGPARRNPEAERRATAAGIARSELLALPDDSRTGGPEPSGG